MHKKVHGSSIYIYTLNLYISDFEWNIGTFLWCFLSPFLASFGWVSGVQLTYTRLAWLDLARLVLDLLDLLLASLGFILLRFACLTCLICMVWLPVLLLIVCFLAFFDLFGFACFACLCFAYLLCLAVLCFYCRKARLRRPPIGLFLPHHRYFN